MLNGAQRNSFSFFRSRHTGMELSEEQRAKIKRSDYNGLKKSVNVAYYTSIVALVISVIKLLLSTIQVYSR